MGKGNPFKNVINAPGKILSGVVHGDVNKIINGAANAASMGTISVNDGSGILDAGSLLTGGQVANAGGVGDGGAAAAEALAQQQADAKAAAISRRRADLSGDTKTVYTSALGDVANTAAGKTKKKTVLGG